MNPHQQRILAAVARVGDDGHGEIEEVDGFDFHTDTSVTQIADKAATTGSRIHRSGNGAPTMTSARRTK